MIKLSHRQAKKICEKRAEKKKKILNIISDTLKINDKFENIEKLEKRVYFSIDGKQYWLEIHKPRTEEDMYEVFW